MASSPPPSTSNSNKDIPAGGGGGGAATTTPPPPPPPPPPSSSAQYSSRQPGQQGQRKGQPSESRPSKPSNSSSSFIPNNHQPGKRRKPPRLPNQSRRNGHAYRDDHDHHLEDLLNDPIPASFSTSSSSSSLATARNISSRKGRTSITHLMDFSRPLTYEEIHHHHSQRFSTTTTTTTTAPRRKGSSWSSRGYLPADKARYVHGNYRFIVLPTHPYAAQATNADVHIDWSDVLQVIASAQYQSTACPICLSHPVAPRMARCGHVFCLPCLIRYMHSNDDVAAGAGGGSGGSTGNTSTNHSQSLPEKKKKQKWKKCPICEDSIYLSHARSVRFYSAGDTDAAKQNGSNGNNTATAAAATTTDVMPYEGADIVLRLMKRSPSNTLALPCDAADQSADNDLSEFNEDIPWYQAGDIADFARIMKGGKTYMLQHYESELEALKKQQKEDELYFGDDTTWIKKAMGSIREAMEVVKAIGDPPPVSELRQSEEEKKKKKKKDKQKKEPINLEEPAEGVPDQYNVDHAGKAGQIASVTSDMKDLESNATYVASGTGASEPSSESSKSPTANQPTATSTSKSRSHVSSAPSGSTTTTTTTTTPPQHPPNQPYYFYQALPHFYLSPLDIRILRAAFGSYESFPPALLTRIERISTGHTIDEDLRKRTKYLSHLPFGCEVAFLECDWSEVVEKRVLDGFDAEIRRRRRRNWEKRVAEDREKVKAEKREEKMWATTTTRVGGGGGVGDEGVGGSVRRPFTEVDFPMGLASAESAAAAAAAAAASANGDGDGDGENGEHRDTDMSAAGPSSASASLSHGQQKTVWGTVALPPSDPNYVPPPLQDDGWLKDWEQEMRLQERMLSGDGGGQGEETGGEGGRSNEKGKGGGKKKKKGKKITLMSTTARRGA